MRHNLKGPKNGQLMHIDQGFNSGLPHAFSPAPKKIQLPL
jgi:hypothetical protein